jgi:hypothetical protein
MASLLVSLTRKRYNGKQEELQKPTAKRHGYEIRRFLITMRIK